MNYETLLKQIESITEGEDNFIANLANVSSLLHDSLKTLWTGFYLVDSLREELILGPFQGPVACTRIPYGKGVCGSAWKEKKPILVADVHQFPGHITCSSLSNSEIVVPIIRENRVIAVLDIDSKDLNFFNENHLFLLKQVALILSK